MRSVGSTSIDLASAPIVQLSHLPTAGWDAFWSWQNRFKVQERKSTYWLLTVIRNYGKNRCPLACSNHSFEIIPKLIFFTSLTRTFSSFQVVGPCPWSWGTACNHLLYATRVDQTTLPHFCFHSPVDVLMWNPTTDHLFPSLKTSLSIPVCLRTLSFCGIVY